MHFLKNICLSFIFLLSNQAYSLNRCENLFAPTKAELSTSDKLTPEQFIDTQMLNLKIYFSEKIARANNNFTFYIYSSTQHVIGEIHYAVENNQTHLIIDSIKIDLKVQNAHLATALYFQILKAHPHIKTIEAFLINDNLNAVLIALQNGVPVNEAILESPSYKISSRFGYTKIIEIFLHKNERGTRGIDLTLAKP